MEESNTDIKEPAIAFKHLLSAGAYKLLNKLILDLKCKLPIEERIYEKKDNSSLIYNLFNAEVNPYKFSYKQYKEIFECICA